MVGILQELVAHAGLLTFTAIAVLITIYLLYAILRPESF